MKARSILAVAVAIAASFTVPLQAQTVSLAAAVAELVSAESGVPVDELRVQVRDAAAEVTGDVEVTRGSGDRWLVTVTAEEGVIRRFARVGATASRPIAARNLQRGTTIVPEDVSWAERTIWTVPAPPVADPVGLVAQGAIAAGAPLESPSVRAPVIVRGGDTVEALLARPGVTMRVRAEALATARAGDRLHVRLASGKRVAATAVQPGLVQLISGGLR